MRILLDFLPLLARGGGLQNALNLWRAVGETGGRHAWLALASPALGLQALPTGPHQELRLLDPGGSARRMLVENTRLRALAARWRADVVFTPMGAAPLVGTVPRVMGWHDSTLAYPESPVHRRLGGPERLVEGVRGAYARAAARRASRVCVQTRTMARRLAAVWGVSEARFRVVPNGPSRFLAGEEAAPEAPPPGPRRVVVVGEAKPAKNLEVVPAVAAALARLGASDVEVVVTLPPGPAPWTGPFERALAAAGAGAVPVRRVGRVDHHALGDLYRSAAAVFLPSLLESFSATYVEAFHFGVPLVTSDLDFAREICGDAALYADPLDPDACARALLRAVGEPGLRPSLREAGRQRLATFPGWDVRLELYLQALGEAVDEAAASPRRAAAPSTPPVTAP